MNIVTCSKCGEKCECVIGDTLIIKCKDCRRMMNHQACENKVGELTTTKDGMCDNCLAISFEKEAEEFWRSR